MAIDSYRFLDFASRKIMKAWAERQEAGPIPFTPLGKPLARCTVALVATAGVARNESPARARNASKGLPPSPIAELLSSKPWLLPRLYTGRIPRHEYRA
jgi:hypothetical protein